MVQTQVQLCITLVEQFKIGGNMAESELDRKSRVYWETYHWLEEYDNQVKQYERAKRLGVEYSPSAKMDYKTFPELDTIANEKAVILKALKDFAYVDHDAEILASAMITPSEIS